MVANNRANRENLKCVIRIQEKGGEKMYFEEEQKYRKEIGIYKIENLVNGSVYVGQTAEGFQKRYFLHRWKLNNGTHDNSHLQRSFNKYGKDNFVFKVIEVLPKELLNEREKYWIEYHRNTTGCYCIQDGGQPENLNDYISPDIRKRTGELNRQRMLGGTLSEETKQKMCDTRRGAFIHHKNGLTEEQARAIKEMLVAGYSTKEIVETTAVDYKKINGILSNNSYRMVEVAGWDEFYFNRPRGKRKSKYSEEQIQQFIDSYHELKNYRKVADKYKVSLSTIQYYIRLKEKDL